MNRLSQFLFLTCATFGLPWLLLVVFPTMNTSRLEAIPYNAEADDGMTGSYPPVTVNTRGSEIYSREGCTNCHTQVIRTANVGLDVWKKGWGSDQSGRPELPTRPTTQWDYLGESIAHLGLVRNGPDLANVGYRYPSVMDLHMKLYDSRISNRDSNMPSFRHLYKLRKIEGEPSNQALPLVGKYAPPAGYEVVPDEAAQALAEYLISLKRDTKLPASLVAKLNPENP
jgi:cytochrome c oxidase cbb3-type subunit II